MSYSLQVHQEAENDLDALWARNEEAAADVLDRLNQHNFHGNEDAPFDVSQWHSQQRQGRNLWRVKLWSLEYSGTKIRIFYAFDSKTHTFYVLAITDRSEDNYDDESHPTTQRIKRLYQQLIN